MKRKIHLLCCAGTFVWLAAARVVVAGQDTNWWSLRPLQEPTPPQNESNWARTPLDQFILAKLREQQLEPSMAADKRIVLRRVYFDLIGLPPTPDEMRAFVEDNSPGAYERVVDRLLSSPRYGERWARHWLDAAHYAETHGHDQDRPRTNSWPYRDYVVRSFNEDKPYARFVEEQIAGDVLFPNDPQAVVAMGFLATGPWDESSLRDIREDTIDRQVARYIDRDDIVSTAMNTFVSSTVQCARCHDHKFDPISQEEYYGLQAIFAATDKADRTYDGDRKVHSRRRELTQRKRAIERRDETLLASMREPHFVRELAAWEKSVRVSWTVLTPVSVTASNTTNFVNLPDGSVLATGATPAKDVYTVTVDAKDGALGTARPTITAIRLEALTDDSLPHKGPGRVVENGNFHLTDFRVYAARSDTNTTPIAIRAASADFNQQGWEISKAIDKDPNSAWGINPEESKPHYAVFELAGPLRDAAPLTFVLEQNHGRTHVIGRFRLSVTSAKPPSSFILPSAIAKILDLPATERTEEQRTELAWLYLQSRIDAELVKLPPPRLVYAGASDFVPDGSFKPAKVPRAVHVLKRGDIKRPDELATPGALSCVPDLQSRFELSDTDNEGSRRAALAKWITHPQNTLTWRSIANRVWHYHFGRGLVETPNDFGRMGAQPSHPELLDWLAVTLRDNGGSLKTLHRMIVCSATYQQSCAHNEKFAQIDSGNRYLWRMNRTRLDAEAVRDAVLHINSKLDLRMGGPSAQQFVMTPGKHVTPNVDYGAFDADHPANYRRSVYRFVFRTLPDPFMDSLDCADASQLTPVRNVSMTALQALAMLNNHFMVRQSEHLAERLTRTHVDPEKQIGAAYELTLGRTPRRDEAKELIAYAKQHGLANACRILLNSNEFMFVN
jgi:hypothetical protein